MDVPVNETETASIVSLPPNTMVSNSPAGIEVVSLEGLPITVVNGTTTLTITDEIMELEAPDISLTAEEGVEIEAGADVDVSVAGAMAVEASDVDIDAAAVEVEIALFTVE